MNKGSSPDSHKEPQQTMSSELPWSTGLLTMPWPEMCHDRWQVNARSMCQGSTNMSVLREFVGLAIHTKNTPKNREIKSQKVWLVLTSVFDGVFPTVSDFNHPKFKPPPAVIGQCHRAYVRMRMLLFNPGRLTGCFWWPILESSAKSWINENTRVRWSV